MPRAPSSAALFPESSLATCLVSYDLFLSIIYYLLVFLSFTFLATGWVRTGDECRDCWEVVEKARQAPSPWPVTGFYVNRHFPCLFAGVTARQPVMVNACWQTVPTRLQQPEMLLSSCAAVHPSAVSLLLCSQQHLLILFMFLNRTTLLCSQWFTHWPPA